MWKCNLSLLNSLSQIITIHLLVKYCWCPIKARCEDRIAFFWWISRKIYVTEISSISSLLNSYFIIFRKLLGFSHFHSFPVFISPTAVGWVLLQSRAVRSCIHVSDQHTIPSSQPTFISSFHQHRVEPIVFDWKNFMVWLECFFLLSNIYFNAFF